MKKQIQGAATAVIGTALATGSAASAQQAVQWRVEDGGNGHWYARSTEFLSFPAAAEAAVARGGHLATPVTPQENAFLTAQGFPYSANGEIYGHWIGGIRSQSTGAWNWITGESWSFSSFEGPEPNGCCGSDVRFLVFLSQPGHEGRWDDTSTNGNWDATPLPALIEWSADCNNDGIVDYGQCRDGSLPDYNGNNIPDCCESGLPCATGNYPLQWRTVDGGNGHWYWVVSTEVGWNTAMANASAIGGHGATPRSAQENEFVFRLARPRMPTHGVWLGASAPTGSCTAPNAYRWVTGELWDFAEWYPGEPNGGFNSSECALAYSSWTTGWNDMPQSWVGGYAIEWSADCNNDGIVDYGQILDGTFADTNTNGIPDVCEAPTCADADLFADMQVNGADLGIMLAQWGEANSFTVSDLNGDGLVDGSDLGILLSFWGPCTP